MLQNVALAQKKQEEHFKAKKEKGLKVFDLKPGDTVLRRNMKNIGRKGGKIEPQWTGPYRYILSVCVCVCVCSYLIVFLQE